MAGTGTIIAAPMKSGSTFVVRVLSTYLAVPEYRPFAWWGWQDHFLSKDIVDRSPFEFVLQSHLKPSRPNLRSLLNKRFRLCCLWRNVADCIVSLADHVSQESHEFQPCYVPSQQWFCNKSLEEQYEILIQSAGPWYIGFWTTWKRFLCHTGAQFHRYEDMSRNKDSFFQEVLREIRPDEVVDAERLSTALRFAEKQRTRKNVRIPGRSDSLFTAVNKRSLERLLLTYCEDDATELLQELPWYNSNLPRGL